MDSDFQIDEGDLHPYFAPAVDEAEVRAKLFVQRLNELAEALNDS